MSILPYSSLLACFVCASPWRFWGLRSHSGTYISLLICWNLLRWKSCHCPLLSLNCRYPNTGSFILRHHLSNMSFCSGEDQPTRLHSLLRVSVDLPPREREL